MSKEGAYEADIKNLILNKPYILGDLGRTSVVFEKGLSVTKDKTVKKVIADCLIFSEKQGIFGLEIKTIHDSTTRLNRQLKSYSLTCDYVYVVCHDDHVPKVEQIIKRYQHTHVGIIAYSEFRGKPIAGVYKKATRSPNKSVYHALNMLWKTEIVKMLGTFRHYASRIEEEYGVNSYKVKDRGGMRGLHGDLVKSTYSMRMTKPQLIKEFIYKVGEEEANKILCDIFIEDRLHPERAIKLRHFNPTHDPRGGNHE